MAAASQPTAATTNGPLMRYPLPFFFFMVWQSSNRFFVTGVPKSDDAANGLLVDSHAPPKRIRRKKRLLFRLDAGTKTGPSEMFADAEPPSTTRETFRNDDSKPARHGTNSTRDAFQVAGTDEASEKPESHDQTRIARRRRDNNPLVANPSTLSDDRNDSRETYEERRALLYRNMFAFDGMGSSLISMSMPSVGKGFGKARQRKKKTKLSSAKMKGANKLSRNSQGKSGVTTGALR